MKVGQLFNLPENVRYEVGVIGKVKDKEDKLIAKYEVVEIKEGESKFLKGRVLVVYGNKRRK